MEWDGSDGSVLSAGAEEGRGDRYFATWDGPLFEDEDLDEEEGRGGGFF